MWTASAAGQVGSAVMALPGIWRCGIAARWIHTRPDGSIGMRVGRAVCCSYAARTVFNRRYHPVPPHGLTCSAYSACPVNRLCMSFSASVRQGLPHVRHFITRICG